MVSRLHQSSHSFFQGRDSRFGSICNCRKVRITLPLQRGACLPPLALPRVLVLNFEALLPGTRVPGSKSDRADRDENG
eukprot:2149097-Rhodomonas_salina.1